MTTCNNGKDARYWIRKRGLLKHPEGGFYRERYRSDITLETHIDFVKQQHDKPVQFGARDFCVIEGSKSKIRDNIYRNELHRAPQSDFRILCHHHH
jgi:hypothetical protein